MSQSFFRFAYQKIVITIVECDTWETSLVHYLRYCYMCEALITILANELVIFPSIAFYYDNNYIIYICMHVHMYGSYYIDPLKCDKSSGIFMREIYLCDLHIQYVNQAPIT